MKSLKHKTGTVYLVGAGPGDPGLITLRGARLLKEADAVVYDGLVSPSLLENIRGEKIYAGKYRTHPSKHYVDQKKINRLLVQLATQGKKVVRLKGGDPFVFGRGGEEALFLKKAGISFEAVPGVSAGHAVPAYAGIPVTDRQFASSVTFVTAHESLDKNQSSVNWKALAELSGTLVIFMGTQNLKQAAERLIFFKKKPVTPVSVIEWGTTSQQKTVSGTLKNIAAKVRAAKLHSPALTVVGEVSRLRGPLQWFEKKPLFGKTVLVTRARAQAGTLKGLLEEQGASVFEFPVIEFLPPKNWKPADQAVRDFRIYDWVVFTSVNGVEFFLNRVKALRKDARIFSGKKIAVIGEATASALEAHGLKADLIPPAFTSESLVKAFRSMPVRGKSFLLARTDIAPPFLREALKNMGARVRDVTVYRTLPVRETSRKKELEKWVKTRKIDFITFTSSSTVKNFFDALAPKTLRKMKSKLISIGPVTTGTLKTYGFRPYREAAPHTVQGLAEAVLK